MDCSGKRRYATRQDAMNVLLQVRRRHPFKQQIAGPYKCPECNGWHWGHQINLKKRRDSYVGYVR